MAKKRKRNRKPRVLKSSEFMKPYVEACQRLSFEVTLGDELWQATTHEVVSRTPTKEDFDKALQSAIGSSE